MKEIWKVIWNARMYSVSNYGRIKNNKTDRIRKAFKVSPSSELLYIVLRIKGENVMFPVHRLVAKAFGKMKRNHDSALHLNYTQYDNREPNLEGATIQEAIFRTRRRNYNKKRKKFNGAYKLNGYRTRPWISIINVGELGKYKRKILGYYKFKKDAVARSRKELNKLYIEMSF